MLGRAADMCELSSRTFGGASFYFDFPYVANGDSISALSADRAAF